MYWKQKICFLKNFDLKCKKCISNGNINFSGIVQRIKSIIFCIREIFWSRSIRSAVKQNCNWRAMATSYYIDNSAKEKIINKNSAFLLLLICVDKRVAARICFNFDNFKYWLRDFLISIQSKKITSILENSLLFSLVSISAQYFSLFL
jgi:hypothetical protein